VAKGFANKYEVHYEESFTLMENVPTVRIILALSIAQGWRVFQLDFNSAFLNGD